MSRSKTIFLLSSLALIGSCDARDFPDAFSPRPQYALQHHAGPNALRDRASAAKRDSHVSSGNSQSDSLATAKSLSAYGISIFGIAFLFMQAAKSWQKHRGWRLQHRFASGLSNAIQRGSIDFDPAVELRHDPRSLCGAHVRVHWRSASPHSQSEGVCVDRSRHGLRLAIDLPLPKNAVIQVQNPSGELQVGIIRYCIKEETRHVLGVELTAGAIRQDAA